MAHFFKKKNFNVFVDSLQADLKMLALGEWVSRLIHNSADSAVKVKERDRKFSISVLMQSTVENADRCSEYESALKYSHWPFR